MNIKLEPTDAIIPAHQEDANTVARSPQPRGRRTRVEVVLPTKRQLYGSNPPEFENASSYIEKHLKHVLKKEEEKSAISLPYVLKHAAKKEEEKSAISLPYGKVEIKKEEMLSEDVVNGRVAAVPSYDVDLDPAVRDVTTTRLFTSKQWGGNTQSTFPNIRPEMLARHGLDDFMYLNLFLNPHAPQWPGAPGLFFTSSVNPTAHEWPKIERVLVRLKSNCWLYVGQYQCTPAPSLTTDEWKSQAPKVKQTWTTKVSTQGWGTDIRAEIVLRKRLGRDPTVKEFEDALSSHEKFHATPEEILHAFDEGHAFILSWAMKCVGYDENFQREIAAGNAAN
ncbi:hypothetical protein V8E55_003564 [Tylopilus felleus]